MPEKVVMAYHAANHEKNDEEATLRKFIEILDNASAQGNIYNIPYSFISFCCIMSFAKI